MEYINLKWSYRCYYHNISYIWSYRCYNHNIYMYHNGKETTDIPYI